MEKNRTPDTALIDTHVHLNEIKQVEKVVRTARSAGVEHIVAVGMDLESNIKTLELAGKFPETVYPAIGYHPLLIRDDEIEETLSFIDAHLDRCIALGEVGLDYKVKVKKPLQYDVFSKVLGLAQKRKKPVIVHSRYSYERTYAMVSEAGVEKAVFHWYSGPLEILYRIVQDGHFVSATPALAYSTFHQAAITKAPLEQILIETDAPVEYQGKASEPFNLTDTLKCLSRCKNLPEAALARITTENAKRFFGI